jgi:hypothetical protein
VPWNGRAIQTKTLIATQSITRADLVFTAARPYIRRMTNQLRVDPAKIRISIRPSGQQWTVKVENRHIHDLWISSTGIDPVDTRNYLLRRAALDGMPGVSRG